MSTEGRPNRRDFLRGRAAVQALVDAVAVPDDQSPPLEPDASAAALVSLRRQAMACEFEVQLPARRQDGAMEHSLAALDLLETLEAQMTIYRADSEVLSINRRAAAGPVAVEPRLFAMFQLAKRLHQETGGAFDITSGPLSEAWGFSRREGRLPSAAEIAAALARVGMDGVELDSENYTVRFRRSGLSLHLNSIGKGYALDRMAESLAAAGVDDFLLHGGRSSVLARGNSPQNSRSSHGKKGWSIGIPHPLCPGELIGEVDLVAQALGTSGSGTQFFEHEGRRYGHLLDPRSGSPAEGIYAATVVAPTAAEADGLSTAFYVMGADAAAAYCAAHPGVGAIVVATGADHGSVHVSVHGVDPDCWRPLATA